MKKSPIESLNAALTIFENLIGPLFIVLVAVILTWMFVLIGNSTKAEAIVEVQEACVMPQEITIDEPEPVVLEELTPEEIIDGYVDDICPIYNLDPYFVKSIIWHESRYDAEAVNKDGSCFGLMQISPRWHADRMRKLGVNSLLEPYGNILVGCDYISELFDRYEDPYLVLMLYNMPHDRAMKLYREGTISFYANSVMARAKQLRGGEIVG